MVAAEAGDGWGGSDGNEQFDHARVAVSCRDGQHQGRQPQTLEPRQRPVVATLSAS